MFKDFEKIASYIDSKKGALISGTADIDQIITELNSTYNLQLASNDLSSLISSVQDLKQAQEILKNTEYASTNYNKSGIDFSTDIFKAQDRVVHANNNVNHAANTFVTQACIKSYNGPLTMDIMKQLEAAKYDGTYGSESMKQMYLMYQENIRVKADNNQCRQELNTCYQTINNQHDQITVLTNENNNLNATNNELKQTNKTLTEKISELSQQVSSLSSVIKTLPKLIVAQLSEVFGKKTVVDNIDQKTDVNKTL